MLMLNYYVPEGVDVVVYSTGKSYSGIAENNNTYIIVFRVFTMMVIA